MVAQWCYYFSKYAIYSCRTVINLAELEPEKTHTIDQPLEDGAGFIKLLLSISGTSGGESISDLANYTPNPREREDIVRKFVSC